MHKFNLPQTHGQSQIKQVKDIELSEVENTQPTINGVSDQIQTVIVKKGKQGRHQSISYKPYVDGLRTIAIMTVVIYHAFPDFMPGGFIGVDVFFVISGYLISQIIIKETKQERFSYINFYSRRVKRIYPALLFVLAFVLYVVQKYYDKAQLDFALKTLSSSTIFGANIQILSHEKGYFDPDVHINPLLHLWSLGVQQQFYFFWPCLISIGLNVFKKRTFLVLALYTAFSFIFGIVCVYINPKFAFYFPVCRFWQMAVGGLIAYFSLKIQNTRINNALSIIGTLSILLTVWIINDESLFPGFWALIPTLASACIIQAGPEPFINKHILSSKVFVFVGKISYPMYLWHWPLLVFSRYLYPEGSTSIFSNLYFVIFVTIILSVLTYYFVQNPIRKIKTKKIVILLLIIMVLIGTLSYWTLKNKTQTIENQEDQNSEQYILGKAQKQMMPRPNEDFIEKNGKMIPNQSKSKNRKHATVEKIKIPNRDLYYDTKVLKKEIILQKYVEQGSIFYVKDRPFLSEYQVANEGREKKLFVFGDSHALRLSYRFQQLYYDSLNKNRSESFPTVLSIIRGNSPLIIDNGVPQFVMQMIKQHKPQKLLVLCHWPIYFCKRETLFDQVPQCEYDKFENNVRQLITYLKQIKQLGVDITAATINFHSNSLSPMKMLELDNIIEDNLKPIKRSQYRNKFKGFFDFYQREIKKAQINLIDLADHLCYEDNCEVISPQGYPVYTDAHHYGKYYARHWLSVVDHLVQF